MVAWQEAMDEGLMQTSSDQATILKGCIAQSGQIMSGIPEVMQTAFKRHFYNFVAAAVGQLGESIGRGCAELKDVDGLAKVVADALVAFPH